MTSETFSWTVLGWRMSLVLVSRGHWLVQINHIRQEEERQSFTGCDRLSLLSKHKNEEENRQISFPGSCLKCSQSALEDIIPSGKQKTHSRKRLANQLIMSGAAHLRQNIHTHLAHSWHTPFTHSAFLTQRCYCQKRTTVNE